MRDRLWNVQLALGLSPLTQVSFARILTKTLSSRKEAL